MDAAAGKCRMLVVNRIDAPGVDFAALMERISASFGKECLPINLPSAGGAGVSQSIARSTFISPCSRQ